MADSSLRRVQYSKSDKFMNTKQLVFVAVMLIATGSLHAQGNGSAGIAEATKMVTSYFDPGTKLCYAIGAVIGLVGGIKVYNKFVRREVASVIV